MRIIQTTIFCMIVLLMASCKKDETKVALPAGSISFDLTAAKDTVEMPLSILKDSTITLAIQAVLSGNTSSADHWVSFAVDTTKMQAYRAKYGSSALLMPASSWLFYKSMTRIAAGSSTSESAQLNIGQSTKLTEYSTYVLPVVIQSVDGNVDGVATNRVIYFVFKTGKPLFVNKTGWAIAGFSSVNGTYAATNIIDNNDATTYWTSNITQSMPQWVAINFNKTVTFTYVNYYLPTALAYPKNGGYPTSFKIETSLDGTAWTDNGTFAGNIANNMQSVYIGETTARYLRFTVLASVKYASAYDAIFISGISLIP